MFVEKLYQCNFCQTVLSGRVKASREEKNYISITGTISLQLWDADAEYRSFFYVSNKPTLDGKPCQMYFCNFNCLSEYAKWKHKDYNEQRKERLREEASLDIVEGRNTRYGEER